MLEDGPVVSVAKKIATKQLHVLDLFPCQI